MKKNLEQNNNQKGFTIIETMIAISLFLVIIMAGMGALLNANLLHRKSQDLRSIMDNLSFIMEDMSKNLRTGFNYHCIDSSDNFTTLNTTKSCENGGGIAFTSANGITTFVYYIQTDSSGGKIFKSTQPPYNILPPNTGNTYVQLNSDEVNISTLSSISVLGAEPSPDLQQPFATIRLVGTITYKGVTSPFAVQTSVSQRLIDIQ